MKKQLGEVEIELQGWNLDELVVTGSGPDLLLACGCSWVRAWGADERWQHQTFNLGQANKITGSHNVSVEQYLDFCSNSSFTGLFRQHLGLSSMVMLAIPGSSNDAQARLLIEFLQRNRSKFRRVFVLWGLTTHVRWELFSNHISAPSMFQLGNPVPPGKEKERSWFFKHHWNEKYELERLSQKIVTIHAYLNSLAVDHLFFPAFESFNSHRMDFTHIDPKNFFHINSNPNDIIGLWCQDQHIVSRPKTVATVLKEIISIPFGHRQFLKDRQEIDQLIDLGLLTSNAHPSVEGHRDIAQRLIDYYQQHRQS